MDPAKALQAQVKIRQEAQRMQEYSSDLARWEASIKKKDANLRAQRPRTQVGVSAIDPSASKSLAAPTPSGNAVPPVRGQTTSGNAASHTYDQGYKKWENFDVDRALAEVDSAEPRTAAEPVASVVPAPSAGPVTPASIVPAALSSSSSSSSARGAFPEAEAVEAKPRDVTERERGNDYYKKGDFGQAVKFYTRAIGFNPRSAVAYSNRAMALLKLKDFAAADADCCSALELDPAHVKSLTRRGTARNALGRHRAAFVDFARVREIEPQNRQAIAEIARTRELIRSSTRRAPRQRVTISRSSAPASPTVSHRDAPRTEEENDANSANEVHSAQTEPAREPAATRASEKPSKPALVAKSEENESMSESKSPGDIDKEGETKIQGEKAPETAEAGLPRRVIARLPDRAPRSMYEFERVWKELRGDPVLRGKLVADLVGPAGLRQLFARAPPEADMLSEMVQALGALDESARSAGEKAADAIADIPSIDMTIMFLSKRERADLAAALAQGGLASSKLARAVA